MAVKCYETDKSAVNPVDKSYTVTVDKSYPQVDKTGENQWISATERANKCRTFLDIPGFLPDFAGEVAYLWITFPQAAVDKITE